MDIISQCQLSTVIGWSFYEIDLDSIPNSNKNTQTAVCIREFESLTTTHKWKIILQNHDTYILKHFEPGTTQSSLTLWKVRCEIVANTFSKPWKLCELGIPTKATVALMNDIAKLTYKEGMSISFLVIFILFPLWETHANRWYGKIVHTLANFTLAHNVRL